MEKAILSPTHDDYEIKEREILFSGFFRVVRYHLRHRTFKGEWSNIFNRELLERLPAVGVLPYDPHLDQVILLEQFRVGAISNPQSPWLLEIVAGLFDANEKPEEVAKRESAEEAGCKILDLHPICEYFTSPGATNETMHIFCARIDAQHAGGIFGLAEENEDIRAFALSAEEAFRFLHEGKIKTSPAIIALQWLQLNRKNLRELWAKK